MCECSSAVRDLDLGRACASRIFATSAEDIVIFQKIKKENKSILLPLHFRILLYLACTRNLCMAAMLTFYLFTLKKSRGTQK